MTGDNDDLIALGRPQQLAGAVSRHARATYNSATFGSAHANGFHMAFCDGSVQMISYTINQETHRRLGNRKDGQAIDGKAF